MWKLLKSERGFLSQNWTVCRVSRPSHVQDLPGPSSLHLPCFTRGEDERPGGDGALGVSLVSHCPQLSRPDLPLWFPHPASWYPPRGQSVLSPCPIGENELLQTVSSGGGQGPREGSLVQGTHAREGTSWREGRGIPDGQCWVQSGRGIGGHRTRRRGCRAEAWAALTVGGGSPATQPSSAPSCLLG